MESNFYCVTWGTSQRLLPKECNPSINLTNNSLRQIFKISLGGNKFRIKLSNTYGKQNLEIKSISIAKTFPLELNKININTVHFFTFNKREEIIIKKGEEIYSDILNIELESSSLISISIYFGDIIPNDITGHKFSMTESYIEKGNKIKEEIFSEEYKIEHWYFISNIELVSNEDNNKCITCFGDSITDGRFSLINKQERWPDFLFNKISKKLSKNNLSINNQSLSGSFLSKEGIERFNKDIINQNGLKYIIILYGINDITKLNKKEDEIIDNYKKIIIKAKENKIKIYGGTLLPFKGYRLYNEDKNIIRNKVNEWIRKYKNIKDGFDDFIDFDLIIRDNNDINKINDIYNSGDGVHLNSDGYKKMVEAFNDLNIFMN